MWLINKKNGMGNSFLFCGLVLWASIASGICRGAFRQGSISHCLWLYSGLVCSKKAGWSIVTMRFAAFVYKFWVNKIYLRRSIYSRKQVFHQLSHLLFFSRILWRPVLKQKDQHFIMHEMLNKEMFSNNKKHLISRESMEVLLQ